MGKSVAQMMEDRTVVKMGFARGSEGRRVCSWRGSEVSSFLHPAVRIVCGETVTGVCVCEVVIIADPRRRLVSDVYRWRRRRRSSVKKEVHTSSVWGECGKLHRGQHSSLLYASLKLGRRRDGLLTFPRSLTQRIQRFQRGPILVRTHSVKVKRLSQM